MSGTSTIEEIESSVAVAEVPASASEANLSTVNPVDPFAPVVMDDHQRNLVNRKAARDAKKPTLTRCLDSEFAATEEARKPVYEWDVLCEFQRPKSTGGLETVTKRMKVTGQTEGDAWAKFCDKIKSWPSPSNCLQRVVKRLGQING